MTKKERAKTPYRKTKVGQVNALRWAYITQLKLRREADINYYLGKALDVIIKGTRFEEEIRAIRTATVRKHPRRIRKS